MANGEHLKRADQGALMSHEPGTGLHTLVSPSDYELADFVEHRAAEKGMSGEHFDCVNDRIDRCVMLRKVGRKVGEPLEVVERLRAVKNGDQRFTADGLRRWVPATRARNQACTSSIS